jgi:hypothetical protein
MTADGPLLELMIKYRAALIAAALMAIMAANLLAAISRTTLINDEIFFIPGLLPPRRQVLRGGPRVLRLLHIRVLSSRLAHLRRMAQSAHRPKRPNNRNAAEAAAKDAKSTVSYWRTYHQRDGVVNFEVAVVRESASCPPS